MLSLKCSVHLNLWLIGIGVSRKHRILWGYLGPLVFEWRYHERTHAPY